MIHPDKAVRELMKDVGKTLRPMGFRGSVNAWTKVTEQGRVTVTRSTRNNWHDGQQCPEARGFSMGVEAVPEQWFHYLNWRRERDGRATVAIDDTEIAGPILMDALGLPDKPLSPTRLWSIRTAVAASQPQARQTDLDFVRENLPWAVEQLARRGVALIEPGRYLKELINQPRKQFNDWEPIVVLLSEFGPSSALEDAIAGMTACYADSGRTQQADVIAAYARSR